MAGVRPRALGRILGTTLLALGAACGDAPPVDEAPADLPRANLQVVDAEGRSVALEGPARRIVSLVPSVTATVLALDAGERLVGRTDFDTAAVLADLPTVGGGLGPDLEVLAALDPDLVIRFGGESDRATPERLDALGIPHVAVRPERIEDVLREVPRIGTLLGLGAEAETLVGRIRAGLDSVRTAVAGRPPVAAAYLMGGSPPWTAGPDTYVGELMELAGGRNVFDDLESPWGGVSPEQVATRDIDVILLAAGAVVDERLLEGRSVRRLSVSLDLPGPDLVRSAWAVAEALRPDSTRPDSLRPGEGR